MMQSRFLEWRTPTLGRVLSTFYKSTSLAFIFTILSLLIRVHSLQACAKSVLQKVSFIFYQSIVFPTLDFIELRCELRCFLNSSYHFTPAPSLYDEIYVEYIFFLQNLNYVNLFIRFLCIEIPKGKFQCNYYQPALVGKYTMLNCIPADTYYLLY